MAKGVTISGFKDVQARLKQSVKKYEGAFKGALYLEGQLIIADSTNEVPLKWGYLQSTKYVAPPQKSGRKWVVEIGYGAIYAARMHELPDPSKVSGEAVNWSRPGSKNKYLEDPFNRAMTGFRKRVEETTEKFAERGISMGGISLAPKQPASATGAESSGSEDIGGNTRP